MQTAMGPSSPNLLFTPRFPPSAVFLHVPASSFPSQHEFILLALEDLIARLQIKCFRQQLAESMDKGNQSAQFKAKSVSLRPPEKVKKAASSQKASVENVNAAQPVRAPSVDLRERPTSVLARHRVHELSDIREVSGSSKHESLSKRPSRLFDGCKETPPQTPPRRAAVGSERLSSNSETTEKHPHAAVTTPRGLGSRALSALSLPLRDIPERRSSASVLGQSVAGSRPGSIQEFSAWKLPPKSTAGQSIPQRGPAESPVRRAAGRDPVSSDLLRQSPCCTFIRTVPPLDILDNTTSRHPRVEMTTRLPSPLFVGGGTIEGQLLLDVDKNSSRKNKPNPIFISKLTIDVIGIEEVSDGRRWIFLSLATEMFDKEHPPPASLIASQPLSTKSELSWQLKPSSATVPFCINLPLNLGPPPYVSRQAGIRYLLCPTAMIRVGNKKCIIRHTLNIRLLTVHDPEKALASLPSPLLASESLLSSPGKQKQNVKITAGLHRQTWVNGARIFVDIHIANSSSKYVKKIEIQLEKSTLWYTHAAAGTAEKSASHLRLPKNSDNEIVSHSVLKKSKDWSGVLPQSSEVRTCELGVPRGHVTIRTGRYFEVRYFLNVIVTVSIFKTIAVQLPVTIIHMNSLDILPNSLAQVAASIEAKRTNTLRQSQESPLYPPYHQGQAFTAARRQSVERMRAERGGALTEDISALTSDLNNSPRRFSNYPHQNHGRQSTLGTYISTENLAPGRSSGAPSSHHHHMRHPSCYHCQLLFDADLSGKASSVAPGPKLPRLQLSTSGLGFSDEEFEVPPDSPLRKVMLSETERKMINQQRELKVQRQWSQKKRQRADGGGTDKEKADCPQGGYWGWKNVAAAPNAGQKLPEFVDRGGVRPTRQASQPIERLIGPREVGPGPARSRSKTNPERLGAAPIGGVGVTEYRRGPRSVDRTNRIPLPAEGPHGFRGGGGGVGFGMLPRRSRDSGGRVSIGHQMRW